MMLRRGRGRGKDEAERSATIRAVEAGLLFAHSSIDAFQKLLIRLHTLKSSKISGNLKVKIAGNYEGLISI